MILVDVFVPGAAKTKGSMALRNGHTGAMKESVAGSSAWRALMAAQVRDDLARRRCDGPPGMCNHGAHLLCGRVEPYDGPVTVRVEAYLSPGVRMPRSWPEYRAPIWLRAGDLDKLVRNVLDALGSTSKNPKYNGGAIVDDNLVCRIVAEKYVASETAPPGMRIVVETL